MIQNLTQAYVQIWETCSSAGPEFTVSYNGPEKRKKEVYLDQMLQSLKFFRKNTLHAKQLNEEQKLRFKNLLNVIRRISTRARSAVTGAQINCMHFTIQ